MASDTISKLSARQNYDIVRKGNTVTVTFSIDAEAVEPSMSASGKSYLWASTGTVRLDNGLCVSLNAYRPAR